MLQQVGAVNAAPLVGLGEVVELLCKRLRVDLASVISVSEGLSSYVLLAVHGAGAGALERQVVMKGADWSAHQLGSHGSSGAGGGPGTGGSTGPSLCLSATGDDAQVGALPRDWQALHAAAGLCSFLAVPIGGPNRRAGVLMLARRAPNAFDDPWWEPLLGLVAAGLLPQLRHEQVVHLVHLMRVLDGASDHLELVALMLQVRWGPHV